MNKDSPPSIRTPLLGQDVSTTPPTNWASKRKVKPFSAVDYNRPKSDDSFVETPPMLDPGTYCMSDVINSYDVDDAKSISVLSEISDVVDRADTIDSITLTQCCTSCAWLSHVFFILGSIYGMAACAIFLFVKYGSMLTALSGSDDTIKYVFPNAAVAGYLFLASMLAVYEMYVLGTIEDAINSLHIRVRVFYDDMIAIQRDIDHMQKKVRKIKRSISTISEDSNQIKTQTRCQSSSLHDLRNIQQRQEEENDVLLDKLATLVIKNRNLEKTMVECKNVVNRRASQIERVKIVRNSIRNASSDCSFEVTNLLHQYQMRLDRMQDLQQYQEKLILQQISYRSEFKGQKIGFTKKEFKHFFGLVPEKFRSLAKQYNFDDFDDLKGEDGHVSRATVDMIIDRLVELAEETDYEKLS